MKVKRQLSPEHRAKIGESGRRTKRERAVPPILRFVRFADIPEGPGCWNWLGHKDKDGYGSLWVEGKHVRAARWIYEALREPLPIGMVPDHLCRNPSCVNPSHLDAKSTRDNILVGQGITAENARKTHCKNGHAFTPENTYVHAGSRTCVACRRVAGLAFYYRRKQAAS